MEASKLNIALLPTEIAWADIEENLVNTAQRLRQVGDETDLVVLPEMFTTGFITEPTILAAIDEEKTRLMLDHVRRWSEWFKVAICGTVIACEGSRYYNRAFFIEPSGEETYYDKHHLFSLGGEARCYTPGTAQSPVIRYLGCNIKMMVCYDLRFPVWSRNVANEYDLLIYPANWPDARYHAWKHLLIARAIENQAYVAGCNRVGTDDYGVYTEGHSMVYNNWGAEVGTQGADGIVRATIDLGRLEHDRTKFPAWRDADRFELL